MKYLNVHEYKQVWCYQTDFRAVRKELEGEKKKSGKGDKKGEVGEWEWERKERVMGAGGGGGGGYSPNMVNGGVPLKWVTFFPKKKIHKHGVWFCRKNP